MEVCAAQVDRIYQGSGRISQALEETGQLDNTLIFFLADNGACAEDIPDKVSVEELVDELMIQSSCGLGSVIGSSWIPASSGTCRFPSRRSRS